MHKYNRSLLGLRLRVARTRAGLAQDRLGVLIGLDEGSSSARISRYESGVHAPPFGIARKLANVLGVPVAYLYCDDDTLAEMLLELSTLLPAELLAVRQAIQRIKTRQADIGRSQRG